MSATKRETAGGGLYQVPPEPSRWPAIGMAVGVHALLLAFLVIGVSWQNNEPVSVEAEVWDLNAQEAAPKPPPPQPQPEPEPQPETPPPQPAPRVAPPPPVEQPAPPKQPDIALEREKKRKEELKQQKLEEQRQERERELAEQKAEEKKAKALADKQAQKEAEKKAEELAKKEDAEKKKKAEKLAKEKAQKLEDARLAKMRAEDLKRVQLAVSANSGSGGSGTAEKSSGPRRDSGYESAIRAKVKGNTAYAGDLNEPGNPTVTFHVDQLPTGEIMSVRKTRSSGIAAFDDAVERAIKASSPLPKKKDGTVERSLEINFKMKDMQ